MRYSAPILLIAMCALSCAGPGPATSVQSEIPSEKIPAIRRAVREKDRSVIPRLIKDLESDDAAIRFYAIWGLEQLTGNRFEYEYFRDPCDSQEAIARWNQWLQQQPGAPVPATLPVALPATPPAATRPADASERERTPGGTP